MFSTEFNFENITVKSFEFRYGQGGQPKTLLSKKISKTSLSAKQVRSILSPASRSGNFLGFWGGGFLGLIMIKN